MMEDTSIATGIDSAVPVMNNSNPTNASVDAIVDDDDGDCSCPICLEDMNRSERKIYTLPCQHCDFNFCSCCIENFCRAAEDDFQMASDGSRQVKISVSCPQCRSKYLLNDLEETVILLRRAHALAEAIMEKVEPVVDGESYSDSDSDIDETIVGLTLTNTCSTESKIKYKLIRDSEMTASQLARKSEFVTSEVRESMKEASLLYERAITKCFEQRKDANEIKIARAKYLRDDAREMWQALLDQLPAEPDNVCKCEDPEFCDGSCGCMNSIEVVLQPTGSYPSKPSPMVRKTVVDETLFQGFDEFMNHDEKVFLTDLFTNGDVPFVAQAALIMNGVRRLALTGKHTTNIKKQNEKMSKYEMQQHIEKIDQVKIQFPLTNHMPGYFLIPTYSYRDGFMTVKEMPWDGSMTPPQRSRRVFEEVYGRFYQRPQRNELYPLTVVTVQAVRGPIGRLGLRRGDIITHVEDEEWHGTAKDLQDYIYDCHAKHPRNEISITVNTNPETCEFLKIRKNMMLRLAQEERERRKQKALINKQRPSCSLASSSSS